MSISDEHKGIQAQTKVCPRCNSEKSAKQFFCSNCGASLTEEDSSASKPSPAAGTPTPAADISKPLGSLVDDQHKKHIKQASIVIMVVAILTIIFAAILLFNLENEIQKVQDIPFQLVNQKALSRARLGIGVIFRFGLIFLVLYSWTKSNPFAATLIVLILYITNIIVSAGIDPKTLPSAYVIKIIIIAALVNGVKSGLAFKKKQ